MKWLWNWLSDAPAGTVTANSQNADLPASNLQDVDREKVFRTGTSTTAIQIVVDLGSSKAVSAFVLLDHTLTSGDFAAGAWHVQANATDVWTSPSVDVTIGAYQAGTFKYFFSSPETYRYWRFTAVKTSAGAVRDFGRLFVGPITDTGEEGDPDWGGLTTAVKDTSVVQRTIGNKKRADLRVKTRTFRMEFTRIPDATKQAVETMLDTVGIGIPVLFQVSASSPLDELVYGRHVTPLPEFKVDSWDGEPKWNWKQSLEEET